MSKEKRWLLEKKYNNKSDKNFEKDLERLANGEPLDYVIGFTDFLGCKIDLSQKPLIPRQETEFWVEKAISDIYFNFKSFQNRSISVLDMFSGSGCIGLAIMRHIKNAKVDFIDSQKNCLKQIKINCKLNNISKKRYKIIKSDIFSSSSLRGAPLRRGDEAIYGSGLPCPAIGGARNDGFGYNYIFSNPPYIAKTKINKVGKSVLKYEPKQALFGGADGIFYINKFLKQAKNYLMPMGKIFMEFSPEQKKEIEKLLKKYNYKTYKFHKDQYGKYRWVMIE